MKILLEGQEYTVGSPTNSNYIRLLKIILPEEIFTQLCEEKVLSQIVDTPKARNAIATKVIEGLDSDIKVRKLACTLKLLDLKPTPPESLLRYRVFILEDGREEIDFHVGVDIQDLMAIAVNFENFLNQSQTSTETKSQPKLRPLPNREKEILKTSQRFKRQ